MPEIRFNMLSKAQVDKFIGKAKINTFVFYLIKWKPHLNRQISWEPTSIMSNMGKMLVKFNQKIKNQNLPYIQDQYFLQGYKLLKQVSEAEQKSKRKWKIQKIIGKRYLNGGIYYFMKWKDHSIFQSDWIAQHGLWRLYAQQLKEFKAQISVFNLPYLEKESFQEFIQLQKTTFLNQPHFQRILLLINNEKTKKQKLMEKKMKKQQQNVKLQPVSKTNEEIVSEFILQLRERFYRPIETLYLKTQYNGVKLEETEYQSTNQLLQTSSSLYSTESNKISSSSKNLRNRAQKKKYRDFYKDTYESDQEKIQSFKNEINQIISQTKTKMKNKNTKQDQSISNSQNDNSIKIKQNDSIKLEPLHLSEIFKLKSQIPNKKISFEFQRQAISNDQIMEKYYYQQQGDSKQIKFQLNGQLSKSFQVDNNLMKKSQQFLMIQENSNHQHFQSNISQQKVQIKEKVKQKQQKNKIFTFKQQQEQVQFNATNQQRDLIERKELDKKFDIQFQLKPQVKGKQKTQQKQMKIRKIIIKKKIQVSPEKVTQKITPQKTFQKEKIISIRLFAQDITSLQNSGQKQNLYEVIFQKSSSQYLKSQKDTTKNEKSQKSNEQVQNKKTEENIKERRFLQTSYLRKYHNSEFLEFLEKEVVKLKKQK